MNFKAIQLHWYGLLKDTGFLDAEDHEAIGMPLKRWSGSSSLYALDDRLIDIIDLHVQQPAEGPMVSSFPEPIYNIKEDFMNYAEFNKACAFLCKPTLGKGRSTKWTPVLLTKVWQFHCDGRSIRSIAKELKLSSTRTFDIIARLTEWMNTMNAMEETQNTYEDDPLPMTQTVVVLRKYKKELDAAFVIASWRNGLWYAKDRDESQANQFYIEANRYIKKLLNIPTTVVKIACLADDPDQIVGYSVITESNLEWVYVKLAYRRQGIASLLSKGIKTVSLPATEIGWAIAKQKGLKVQGESNGTSAEGTETQSSARQSGET